MEHSAIEAQTIFGLDPTWLAASLFVITYGLIMVERVNRAIIALLAAGLMILSGVLTQEAAIQGIDFNTIGLLTGMMIIVAITRQSGVFQFLVGQTGGGGSMGYSSYAGAGYRGVFGAAG